MRPSHKVSADLAEYTVKFGKIREPSPKRIRQYNFKDYLIACSSEIFKIIYL